MALSYVQSSEDSIKQSQQAFLQLQHRFEQDLESGRARPMQSAELRVYDQGRKSDISVALENAHVNLSGKKQYQFPAVKKPSKYKIEEDVKYQL